jgi:hypothetical protein
MVRHSARVRLVQPLFPRPRQAACGPGRKLNARFLRAPFGRMGNPSSLVCSRGDPTYRLGTSRPARPDLCRLGRAAQLRASFVALESPRYALPERV